MMLLMLLAGIAWGSLPAWPVAEATAPGDCSLSIGIAKGSPLPPSIVGDGAVARCSFIAEPLTSYAHLLAIESHAKHVRELYVMDVAKLTEERDHWRAVARRNRPWTSQPWFVAVTVSALVSSAVLAYDSARSTDR